MATPNLKKVGYSSLRYNEKAARYVNEQGRFISPSHIRDIVDADIEHRAARMQEHAESLCNGSITPEQFEAAMRKEVKAVHLVSVAAARGGIHNMGSAGFGQAGGLVRFHYERLASFREDIESGRYGVPPNLAAVADRTSMYSEAGRSSFEYVRLGQEQAAGYLSEENELEPGAHHCEPSATEESCQQQTAKGRVPVGTLVLIGKRKCKVRCKCKVNRFKTAVAA